jgi:putative SOS response-associated peptidase YedK
MCGRFTIAIEPADLQAAFGLQEVPAEWQPRYNVAPSQPVAVIRDAKGHHLEFLKWGLVPFWAKDPSISDRMINARSETLKENLHSGTPSICDGV